MQNELYDLTSRGRKIGDVLAALYRANRFLTTDELMQLSHQDKEIVDAALNFLLDQGWIERMADGPKWNYIPEARAIIEELELRTGKRL